MKELKALHSINIIKMTQGFLLGEMDSQPVCLSLANPHLDYPFIIVVFLSLSQIQLFATPPMDCIYYELPLENQTINSSKYWFQLDQGKATLDESIQN